MKKYLLSLFVLLMLVSLGVLAQTTTSETMSEMIQITTTHVESHPSQGEVQVIEGASAMLLTNEQGLFATLETTGLEDGHVYSMWVVITNNPDACAGSLCMPPDIIGNNDVVQGEATWGDSMIYDSEDGRMVFNAHLRAGDLPESWWDHGLIDPLTVEVHLIINDHGPIIGDMASTMLNTYRGGCTDESIPPPFPDTAKSDGEAGPNECRLMQAAIFTQ